MTKQIVVAVSTSSRGHNIGLWSNNFLSNWFFIWVLPIIKRASPANIMTLQFNLRHQETARVNVDKLEREWKFELEANSKNPSILRAMRSAFGTEYMAIAAYKIVWIFFTWAGAWYLLLQMINFLGKTNLNVLPDFNGHMYALALFLAGFFSSIAIHQQYSECNRVGIKVKAAVMGLIYRKSLKLSRVKGGAGEVLNLMTGDVIKINEAIVNFHFLWSAFLEVALILALSFYQIGISALPALGFVLILLPIQMYLGKRTNDLGRAQSKQTILRVHLMSELLTAIKLIKFYAWEMPFAKKISELRKKETKYIYDGLITKTINYTVVFAIPVLVALTCLSTYVAIGNKLTASVVFAVLSVFNTLRYPFFMLPIAVKSTAGALASAEHLTEFLLLDEIIELKQSVRPEGCDLAVEIIDSDFKWDGAEGHKPSIHDISLKLKKGSKIAIVGDVGSGKSSIIAAILGQIRQVRGDSIKVYGSTAYMSQEAWLLNMTLRENVLFGKEYNAKKYNEVIRVAGLERDLTLLIAADQTEIAERGANLSGGQRQRVSLARAIYYDSDIVLLDDPLSAVDQHVGRQIFDECFKKHLKEKTVIVSMNQLQYLTEMDYIVYVQNGTIHSQGTYKYLMDSVESFHTLVSSHVADSSIDDEIELIPHEPEVTKNAEIQNVSSKESSSEELQKIMDQNSMSLRIRNQLSIRKGNRELNEHSIRSMLEKQSLHPIAGLEDHDIARFMRQNELSVHTEVDPVDIAALKDEELLKKGKLVQDDLSTKTAGFGDFLAYAKAENGVFITLLVVITFSLVHGLFRIGGDFWLRLWVPRVGNFTDQVYVGVYGAFCIAFSLGALGRGLFFTKVTTAKAIYLHDKLFDAAIHAPMGFYDTTPIARILSCFSKHQLHVDDTMLDAAMQALQYFPLGFGALIICAATIPWNWLPCVILLFIGYIFIKVTSPADIGTKSLEAVTKPPIYSHLTATLEGLLSIRSYHAESRFDDINLDKIDKNHAALFAMQNVKSFQALYIDILSSLVIYFAALLLVFARNVPSIDSVAGLALSNALQMLVFVRQWGDVETQMSSVGQLVYYGNVKPEAPFEIPTNKPPPDWPQEGRIKFTNIELKYQKFGVSVLKNISLTIYPKEKIGIVGRTGSGKSTLLISLLRIVEPCHGTITIDDLDVSGIGLHDLRNKIAIIPQEPVMFVGTIRSNLDPFNKSTDEEIWRALDAVFLGESFRNSPSKLETLVSENGKSVSQGQRQLLCIARAILSKAKVLVLDEATASLDAQTDLMIQEAIKKNFGELTMLTIAHRLNTIIESDRVLVMDAGKAVEFDEPVNLLKIPNGIFKSLIDQTGELAAKKLIEIAGKAHNDRVENGYDFPALKDKSDDQPLKVDEIFK
ncbi:Multidrug resistance-associated protein 1 [Terramyces sp. JEL0728]|nr:Multidrug resistance-associated protein 1 [Terramyces sp. JEL0728]